MINLITKLLKVIKKTRLIDLTVILLSIILLENIDTRLFLSVIILINIIILVIIFLNQH